MSHSNLSELMVGFVTSDLTNAQVQLACQKKEVDLPSFQREKIRSSSMQYTMVVIGLVV